MKPIDAGATTPYVMSLTLLLNVTRHRDFPQTEDELRTLLIEGLKKLGNDLSGNVPDIIEARVSGPQPARP